MVGRHEVSRLLTGLVATTLLVSTLLPAREVAAQQQAQTGSTQNPCFPEWWVGRSDWPVPGGWFFTQESRGWEGCRGFTIVDDAEAAFWTGFRRWGGLEVLGFPLSRRYRYPDENGLLHQAFQRGILQWRPELGEAIMANAFEQFTEQGLDEELEFVGIPRPRPTTQLSFGEDAERRMTWLTESRITSRYLFNPLTFTPFEVSEAAWPWLGLPQTFPEQPVFRGGLVQRDYVVQRFQKGGLQLFLNDRLLHSTIVLGDGRVGCVALTAVGRLARDIGAGRIIPGAALRPLPEDPVERVVISAAIPPLVREDQVTSQFELVGTGFDPGEPITVRLIPADAGTAAGTAGTVQPLPVTVRVDAADSGGSFAVTITARVGTYNASVVGERSRRTNDPTTTLPIDLRNPTQDMGAGTRTTFC